MTDFTSTAGNDDFIATSGPDRFFFGENQGVDLIVGFDPAQDKLVYTDRSVDGFDDLGISRLSNGDTAVESNDQVTVLQGIGPNQLRDSDFVFTTSGPRYTIDRARENNDRPDDVSVRDINQREARIAAANGGSTNDGNGSTGGQPGGTTGRGEILSGFLQRAGFGGGLGLRQAMASQFTAESPSASASDVATTTRSTTSHAALLDFGNRVQNAMSLFSANYNDSRG